MSQETFDPTRYNTSQNTPFSQVLEKSLSRRTLLKSGAGMTALSMLAGFGLSGCDSDDKNNAVGDGGSNTRRLGFSSIAGSKTDAVVVPEGYTAQVLAPWGTPLNSQANAWKNDGSNSATDQLNAMGMHHDGMYFFPLNGSATDGLLCVNHEYLDRDALHPNGPTTSEAGLRTSVEEVRKEIYGHGVSVVRIRLNNDAWELVADDAHNQRFTGATVMDIGGPLAGHAKLQTPFAPNGDKARGTLNNCGNGWTPWGTYLTCEENWPGYFITQAQTDEADNRPEDQKRIGLGNRARYGWHDMAGNASEVDGEFARFDVTPKADSALQDYRNEANGHGYIVEIDPYSPNTRAVKRTALGRFRHEGCAYGKLTAGQPVVFYSGHDARFEYVYKFVSEAKWDPADADRSDKLAVGSKYMDKGTLYVARFDENGQGVWLPLTLESATTNGATLGETFASLAELIINTAGAADLVGATPMDRPEWTAVDPVKGSVYLTLTNNTKRTEEKGTNVANPRLNNKFGHIIRWDEGDSDTVFTWDIFLFGSPADGDAQTNLSGLSDLNQLASPDGLAFDSRGILWVQTDNGADEVEDYTNDQMLAVIPSQLLDSNGKQKPLRSDNQAELKRFFVGPNGCEVTGIAFTPDHKTCFVNIQHPANWPFSDNAAEATPEGTRVRPRASTVAIRRKDGGEVGL